ncbi:MAG: hypothetical protein AB1638_02775 [Nitrospirota bacterium]
MFNLSLPDPRSRSRACLIGQSRSFDRLRITGFGACPVLDTGVKPEADEESEVMSYPNEHSVK